MVNRQARRSRPLLRVKSISLAVASCFSLCAFTAHSNPVGPTVVNGQVSFNPIGNTLNITNSPGAIINWRGFSIGANELTRFIQQSAGSSVLNRVVGDPSNPAVRIDPSVILGA